MESKVTKISQSWMVSQFIEELDAIDTGPICNKDEIDLLTAIRLNVTHFGYYTDSDEKEVQRIKTMVDEVKDGYGVFSIKDIENMKSFYDNIHPVIHEAIINFHHIPPEYLPPVNVIETGSVMKLKWRELYGMPAILRRGSFSLGSSCS